MIYWIGHIFWIVVSKMFFSCRVRGLKNLPVKGGFIFASNHLSNLDPMIIGISSRRRLSYVAKDSLFRNKFFSFILYQVGAFPIKRGAGDVGALKEAIRRLKTGCPVVVFPEGTRRKSSGSGDIQSGVGFLAVKSGLPVVPVFINGSDKVLPAGRKFPVRHRVTVTFGKPVVYYDKDYLHVAEEIMRTVESLNPGLTG